MLVYGLWGLMLFSSCSYGMPTDSDDYFLPKGLALHESEHLESIFKGFGLNAHEDVFVSMANTLALKDYGVWNCDRDRDREDANDADCEDNTDHFDCDFIFDHQTFPNTRYDIVVDKGKEKCRFGRKGSLTCGFCGLKLASPYSLQRHENLHYEEAKFRCSVSHCKRILYSEESRARHERTLHHQESFSCRQCGHYFTDSFALSSHHCPFPYSQGQQEQVEEGDKKPRRSCRFYPCPCCGIYAKTLTQLVEHMGPAHNSKSSVVLTGDEVRKGWRCWFPECQRGSFGSLKETSQHYWTVHKSSFKRETLPPL